MIRAVRATDTEALRRAVLRPGDPRPLPGDTDPSAVHLGLYDGDALLACGNVRPDQAPFPTDGPAWRLRGMATAPDRRGQGLGAQVLTGLLEHAAAAGAEVVWCNARTPARTFYERAGLQVWGQEWVDPEIGPHVVMWRRVSRVS